MAGTTTAEAANQFLRERYIAALNAKFRAPAAERESAFRRTSRRDPDWIFSAETERVVARDNTVTIKERTWQIDKTKLRHTLAGCTVTVHDHLDGTVSNPYGPHVVRDDGYCCPLSQTKNPGGSRRLKNQNRTN